MMSASLQLQASKQPFDLRRGSSDFECIEVVSRGWTFSGWQELPSKRISSGAKVRHPSVQMDLLNLFKSVSVSSDLNEMSNLEN